MTKMPFSLQEVNFGRKTFQMSNMNQKHQTISPNVGYYNSQKNSATLENIDVYLAPHIESCMSCGAVSMPSMFSIKIAIMSLRPF